jgi:tetratricopeptide (TPR) repeat protein
LSPNNASALANLGACLAVRKESFALARAGQLCRCSLGLQPENQIAWTALGQTCEAQRKLADAKEAYQHALRTNPQGKAADLCRRKLKKMR